MRGMIKLIPESLSLPSLFRLSQFEIKNISFDYVTLNTLKAELIFQRGVTYHLANTYMPTTSLLVLVILTLFLDESK